MAEVYDTGKIREAAAKVADMCESLNAEAVPQLSCAGESVGNLMGRVVERCMQSLETERCSILEEARHLENISNALNAYADALEAEDQKLAAEFRG